MLHRIKAGHKAMVCNDIWVKITSLFLGRWRTMSARKKQKKKILLLVFHEVMKMASYVTKKTR